METKLAESAAPEVEVEEKQQQVTGLEHEIECPRCRDSMILCSDFDSLYYFCEGCDFCLYTLKK
jgi:cytochrome c-type biogenesis protein CcmH/NrfF